MLIKFQNQIQANTIKQKKLMHYSSFWNLQVHSPNMRGHEVRCAEPNAININPNQKLNLNLNSILGVTYNSTPSTAMTNTSHSSRIYRANDIIRDGSQGNEEDVVMSGDGDVSGSLLRRQGSDCQNYTPHVYNRLANSNTSNTGSTIRKSSIISYFRLYSFLLFF